jgi:hypothetical protein
MSKKSQKPSADDRAARVAKLQKEAKAHDRRGASGIWIGLGLVMVLIVGAVTWAIVDTVRNRPDLSAVQVYDDPTTPDDNLPANHVNTPVTYEQTPPVGGDHHPTWWNCGVYDEPVPSEHAVHALEHGAVWITYQPDLPAEQVEQLEEVADQDFLLLSPYEGLDSPIYLSAWGHQLAVDSADDDRIEAFISDFKQGPQTPEPGAACSLGTDVDLVPRG